jgi:hypothetical protein
VKEICQVDVASERLIPLTPNFNDPGKYWMHLRKKYLRRLQLVPREHLMFQEVKFYTSFAMVVSQQFKERNNF